MQFHFLKELLTYLGCMEINELLEHCEGIKNHHGQYICSQYNRSFANWIADFDNVEPVESRVKHLKEKGLDANDGFFIWSYTGSSSSWLNADRRNGEPYNSLCKELFAEGLEYALNKLPVYEGECIRMEGYDAGHFKWFKNNIGITIRIPYFLSSSKDDYNNTVIVWRIKTHSNGSGRDISLISNNSHEHEILFNRNSRFCVVGINDDNPEKLIVELFELPIDADCEIELSGLFYKS